MPGPAGVSGLLALAVVADHDPPGCCNECHVHIRVDAQLRPEKPRGSAVCGTEDKLRARWRLRDRQQQAGKGPNADDLQGVAAAVGDVTRRIWQRRLEPCDSPVRRAADDRMASGVMARDETVRPVEKHGVFLALLKGELVSCRTGRWNCCDQLPRSCAIRS